MLFDCPRAPFQITVLLSVTQTAQRAQHQSPPKLGGFTPPRVTHRPAAPQQNTYPLTPLLAHTTATFCTDLGSLHLLIGSKVTSVV